MAEASIHRRCYKYRIYPTKAQISTLERQLALCAELYNAALQERRDAWRLNRVSIGFFNQSKQLPEIKKLRPDLTGVNCHALEDVLKRVDKAFKAFFRRVKQGQKPGYPRFRSGRRYDSLTFRLESVTPRGNGRLVDTGKGATPASYFISSFCEPKSARQ